MTRLFVEQLTVIDGAFLDPQRGLVGESWIVDLELEGGLDEQGMVLDFGEVKRRLKRVIDERVDHRLIVPARAPQLHFVQSGDRSGLAFRSGAGLIEHQAPMAALCLLDEETVSVAGLAEQLREHLRTVVPPNVAAIGVHLRHEPVTGPYYHYTHGLKKHAGHCQRIAHGHRSRLEIRVDGQRDERLEKAWAERWRDIYLGSTEDIVRHGSGRIRFAYSSGEGEFELELPAERCDLLATDSTVERIAEHLAARVAEERPGRRIEVRAYEGVMKGAVASAPGPVL